MVGCVEERKVSLPSHTLPFSTHAGVKYVHTTRSSFIILSDLYGCVSPLLRCIAGALVERGLQVLQNYVLSAWSNATSRAAGTSAEPLGGHSEQFYLMLYFVSGGQARLLSRTSLNWLFWLDHRI